MEMILRMFENMMEVLFPRVCHLCGTPLADGERFICTSCVADLPRTHYHRIPDNRMVQRFAGLIPFEHAAGHFYYARHSALSQLFQDMKYRSFPGLARYLGALVGEELFTTSFLSDVDLTIPVPMYFIKKARRGYNQTEEIAKGLESATGIPYSTILKATAPHKTQTSLTKEERQKNTSGIFSLKNPDSVKGKHILILDDVCTTGSTLLSAVEAVISAQPDVRISLLTLGVTY